MPGLWAQQKGDAVAGVGADKPQDARMPLQQYLTFALLALVLTISAGIGSIVVVHLLIFLQAKGITFAEAVTLGTLFRPAQVGARFVQGIFGERYHPIWTIVRSCCAIAARPA